VVRHRAQIVHETFGWPGGEIPSGTGALRIAENALAIASPLFAALGTALMWNPLD
jgi:hypothetical protein